MSSNLLKSYYLNRSAEDARVIDTNDLVAQKLERIRMVLPDMPLSREGFEEVNLVAGEVQDPADLLSMEQAAGDEEMPAVIKGNVAYSGPDPEEIIARAKSEAQKEIDSMRSQAKRELEAERASTLDTAKKTGYEEGKQLAMQEVENAWQEIENARQELEAERGRLQEEYDKKVDELEPMFVRTLTGIYDKIFEAGLVDKQEIVVTLLRNTMKKIEGCKNFLIHVSATDYPYVKEHKGDLLSESSQEGTVIDIVEDSMIREQECTIETANGIYDCGIGTQLSELRKKLMLLSYDGQQES